MRLEPAGGVRPQRIDAFAELLPCLIPRLTSLGQTGLGIASERSSLILTEEGELEAPELRAGRMHLDKDRVRRPFCKGDPSA